MKSRQLFLHFKKVYLKGELFSTIRKIFRYYIFKFFRDIFYRFLLLYYRFFRRRKDFVFNGKIYRYFFHKYNTTWENERCIEIPIIEEILSNSKNKEILEVGNVLSHYFKINHEVVDKYEKDKEVINEDIVNFNPNKKYDLIISISTLEHVGFKEDGLEPKKFIRACSNLSSLLKPKGKMVATLSMGYNPFIDELFKKNRLPFSKYYFMKRVSKNIWQEANLEKVKNDFGYAHDKRTANVVLIGILEKYK